jgi:hypothetical protein
MLFFFQARVQNELAMEPKLLLVLERKTKVYLDGGSVIESNRLSEIERKTLSKHRCIPDLEITLMGAYIETSLASPRLLLCVIIRALHLTTKTR